MRVKLSFGTPQTPHAEARRGELTFKSATQANAAALEIAKVLIGHEYGPKAFLLRAHIPSISVWSANRDAWIEVRTF